MDSVTIISGLIAFIYMLWYLNNSKLRHIPSPVPSGPISSWFSAYRFVFYGKDVVREGYSKFKGRVFKVPEFTRWNVVVSSPELIEELRKAPDDKLSFHEGINMTLQLEYAFGKDATHNDYHVHVIRTQLTRSLIPLFPDIYDEIARSFNDLIPPSSEWVKVPVVRTMMQVVSRVSNRIFVGLPLCRDKQFCGIGIQFAIDVIQAGMTLNMTPPFLRPLVGRLISTAPKRVDQAMTFLGPMVEERLRTIREHGDDWEDKPNDMLTWLIEGAEEQERNVRGIVMRILVVNFAAIHTSSMSFAHALFKLAVHPEYIAPLREEIAELVRSDGWTKAAMQKMTKLDSFLKESQRVFGLGALTMGRLALQDFTFSDGTLIPKGTLVLATSHAMHHDDAIYADADVFDPWRFANLRADGESTKHQMVNTSSNYISFGHGKHACPGRFFAVNELKAMMAHTLVTYDIKPEVEGVIPEAEWFRSSLRPNLTASVMFRKRQA